MRIGVDPGISGGLSLLSINLECLEVVDMPVVIYQKTKHQVSPIGICRIIEGWQETYKDQGPFVAFLESVSSRPGQGVSSMFNFGMGYGVVQGVLAALKVPYILVTPQSWKKTAGLIGAEKDKARTVAQQIYPTVNLSKKKDIGKADSILIARFGHSKS